MSVHFDVLFKSFARNALVVAFGVYIVDPNRVFSARPQEMGNGG